MKKLILFVIIGFVTSIVHGDVQEKGLKNREAYTIDAVRYPELAKFEQKHFCSIDTKQERVFSKGTDIARIENADRMKKIIAIHKLDRLSVAQKYLSCSGPGNCEVIAKAVVQNDDNQKRLSLVEVQQLAVIAEEAGFRDWSPNLLRDDAGKLIFIDTEDSSFYSGVYLGNWIIPTNCKAINVKNLLMLGMEPEAETWVINRSNELLQSFGGIFPRQALPENEKYADSSIDFARVKEEFEIFQKEEPIKDLVATGACKNGLLAIKGMGKTLEKSEKIRSAIIAAKRNGKQIDLSGADCSNLDLSNMDLSDINFSSVRAENMKISGSDISRADFSNAMVWGMKMRNIKGIDTATFRGAKRVEDINNLCNDYDDDINDEEETVQLRKILKGKSSKKTRWFW